jgi:hypothetical protein
MHPLPDELQRTGLNGFARTPPDDAAFIVTRMWDKYMPGWRTKPAPKKVEDLTDDHKGMVEALNELTESPHVVPHAETDVDKLSYIKQERKIPLCKGKWRRFSEETEQRIRNNAQ